MENTESVAVGAVARTGGLGSSLRAADVSHVNILESGPVVDTEAGRLHSTRISAEPRSSSWMTAQKRTCDLRRNTLCFMIDVSVAGRRQRWWVSPFCLCAPKGGQL